MSAPDRIVMTGHVVVAAGRGSPRRHPVDVSLRARSALRHHDGRTRDRLGAAPLRGPRAAGQRGRHRGRVPSQFQVSVSGRDF